MKRAILGLWLALLGGPALAGEAFVGLYAHDINDEISVGGYEDGAQVVFGVRTAALDELAFLKRPRVRLLVGANTNGGLNYLATGLSWRYHLTSRLYVEPGVGVAVHDGAVDLPSPYEPGLTAAEARRRLDDWTGRLDLGSRFVFEPELNLGWKATERLSVELSWAHLSHAQLGGRFNPGVSDVGLRLVYRYGVDR